jgi:phospholipase C
MTYPITASPLIQPKQDAAVTFQPATAGLISVTVVATGRPVTPAPPNPKLQASAGSRFDAFTVAVQAEIISPSSTQPVATSALGYLRVDDVDIRNQVIVTATVLAADAEITGQWSVRIINAPPASHPTPEAAPIACDVTIRYQTMPGNLGKIDHIVVAMMENRSFDHMLGFLTLEGRTDLDGLSDAFYNLDSAQVRHEPQERGTSYFVSDPGHGWSDVAAQLAPAGDLNSNAGFVTNFEKQLVYERTHSTRTDDGSLQTTLGSTHQVTFQPSTAGHITAEVIITATGGHGDSGAPPPGSSIVAAVLQRPDQTVVAQAAALVGETAVPPLSYSATAADAALPGNWLLLITNHSNTELTLSWTLTYPGVDSEEPPDAIMQFYSRQTLSVYGMIADHFAVCDRWFAALPTDTWPNRLYALTGGSGGLTDSPHTADVESDPPGYTLRTIFEVLQSCGVEWNVFFSDLPFSLVSKTLAQDAQYTAQMRDIGEFKRRAALGQLPPFCWIDPNFNDIPDGGLLSSDDHPGAPGNGNVLNGQAFVADLYATLTQSPAWPKTMLIIVYDEHGGFFDHVLPPGNDTHSIGPVEGVMHVHPAPPPGAPPDDNPQLRVYGVRVPALIASPWAVSGSVSHTFRDHTSILATAVHRFCPTAPTDLTDMGSRAAAANDLADILSLDSPNLSPPPAPPVPTPDQPPTQRNSAPDDSWAAVLRTSLFGF